MFVYLGLGSNLGDRLGYLAQACFYLEQQLGKIQQQSAIYETAPWGVSQQPNYFNQVLEIETQQTPSEVLQICLNIELQLGRRRQQKWGARTIDIDVLLYENLIIHTTNLQIPHPYLHERRFVLEPLCSLIGQKEHPILKKKLAVLLDECPDTGVVSILEEVAEAR